MDAALAADTDGGAVKDVFERICEELKGDGR
jgi:hypothetical protein